MDKLSEHATSADPSEQDGTREVWNSGFCSLMVMQFAGAMNDNILRSLISVSVAIGGIWAATKVGTTVGTPADYAASEFSIKKQNLGIFELHEDPNTIAFTVIEREEARDNMFGMDYLLVSPRE